MKVLILHGPNLNLIGKISSNIGETLTLDKINSNIKKHARKHDVELKIFQTHKVFQAINFIQRNRNWSNNLIFAPMAWALYEFSILEAISICKSNCTQLIFNNKYKSFDKDKSIFTSLSTNNVVGAPEEIYIKALDLIITQN